MAKRLYRVIVTTGTPQDRDRGQTRVSEVLYCGYDRDEALRVYHGSKPLDFGGANYTGPTRWTVGQSKEISPDPDDVPDTIIAPDGTALHRVR